MFKKILLACALLLPTYAAANTVKGGQVVFTSGATGAACNTPHLQTWTNSSGSTLNIAKIQIWNGLGKGTYADVPEIVYRKSDDAILIDGGHDDYVDGGPVRIQTQDWGGNYFELAAGDSLVFSYSCYGTSAVGGWVVTIWTVN